MKRVDFRIFGCKVLEDLYIIYNRTSLKLQKCPILKKSQKRNLYIFLQTYCITMDSGEPAFENPVTFDTTQGNTTVSLTTTPAEKQGCLLYTSPSPRDRQKSRMPSSA